VNHLDEIIKGCVRGNRDSQGKLYQMFSGKMYGVCLYYSKDQTEAEDILHEGFLKVFNYISQYKGEGSFEGWIRRIMVNTSLEKYRKQNILYPVGDIYDYIEDVGYEDIISNISMNDLLKMIQDLSPQYRMVFNLYVMEGLSHKEISELLVISEGTSKSNLSRARTILQNRIKKEFFPTSVTKNKLVV